jgi:DNA-binding transcriptional LysR family regulator
MTFVGFDQPELRLGLMASRGVTLTTANFNFSTSSATLALEFVRQGFGIGLLPTEISKHYPELENPSPAFEPISIETWLVAHRELKTNLRIRVVFDLLAEGIG